MAGIALKIAIAHTLVTMFGIPMCNGVYAIVKGTNPQHFWGDIPGFRTYGPWEHHKDFAGVRQDACKLGKELLNGG
jgi:hypothetical protein